ncbi:MAG: hydrogenase expression/formation protein HypE [Gammaproteobacteria bacterium]
MKNSDDQFITLAHGNGGRLTRDMIKEVFYDQLKNPFLDIDRDAITVPVLENEIVTTTDTFTVQPLEFPGGNIGSLSVHGTVNDLAVCGAKPLYLTLNAIIEEGLSFDQLRRVVHSLAEAARQASVSVVAGDTKVVSRDECGGIYLATTGIGIKTSPQDLCMSNIKPGDSVLVSGPVGDHGTAVMLAREEFGLRGDLKSDSRSVFPLTEAIQHLSGLRFMRDPTRGGLATIAHEINASTGLGITLREQKIPVNDQVRSVCNILGYDPYYLASEGQVVAILDPGQATVALDQWQSLPDGRQAAIIGTITSPHTRVVLETELGGERLLPELLDDPLPRIC